MLMFIFWYGVGCWFGSRGERGWKRNGRHGDPSPGIPWRPCRDPRRACARRAGRVCHAGMVQFISDIRLLGREDVDGAVLLRLGCFPGTAFRPVAEGGDLAVHELCQGDGAGDGFEDVLGLGFLAFGVCLMHGVDEHRFDLRPGELLAGAGEDDGVEVGGLALVPGDDDVPDLRTLQGVGQIDEEHLVEPSLAQELGRELGDIVRRRHDEHRLCLLLHPAQERAEDTGGGAAVGAAARRTAGEAFLDLIDPQHARGDGLGGLDDGTEVGFRLSDDAAEDTPHVEAQQGQAECSGGGFRGQGFPGAGDAYDEQAFRCGKSVGFGGFAESPGAALQPFLEQAESADVLQRGGVPDDLDEAVAFQRVCLFAGDDAVVDPVGLHDGEGECVLRFRGGESEGGLDGCLPHHFVDVFQLRRLDDAIEHGV